MKNWIIYRKWCNVLNIAYGVNNQIFAYLDLLHGWQSKFTATSVSTCSWIPLRWSFLLFSRTSFFYSRWLTSLGLGAYIDNFHELGLSQMHHLDDFSLEVSFTMLIAFTVKRVLSGTQKEHHKLVFNTNYRLMQVKSIAECSNGSILQYFRPSLSYHFPLRPLFCLFLSGCFRQVLLYDFACWDILNDFFRRLQIKKIYISSRTGLTFCWTRSGSKVLTKVISRASRVKISV